MKFKIDENLPIEIAGILNRAGHDATTVLSEKLQCESDETSSTVCQEKARILITMDLDFADILAYPPDRVPGFLVLRPHHQNKHHLISLVERLVPLLGSESVEHRFKAIAERPKKSTWSV